MANDGSNNHEGALIDDHRPAFRAITIRTANGRTTRTSRLCRQGRKGKRVSTPTPPNRLRPLHIVHRNWRRIHNALIVNPCDSQGQGFPINEAAKQSISPGSLRVLEEPSYRCKFLPRARIQSCLCRRALGIPCRRPVSVHRLPNRGTTTFCRQLRGKKARPWPPARNKSPDRDVSQY